MKGYKGKVLIAAPVHAILIEGLTNAGYECIMQERIIQSTAFSLISDCAGVVTSTRLQLNRELLDAAPDLKWIGRMGSGMEVIDVPYATSKGIKCFSSPEGNCNAVAEHTLGMLLSLTKRIVWSHNEVGQGLWKRDENRGTELEGKTIGIIGFGHTGRALAKKLQCFDMKILVYDKYANENIPEYVSCCNDLNSIYEQADIISFHVPLQPDTYHYFNDNFITNMRKAFILLNTSRGNIADTKALLKGLKNGKVKGACLDVFEEEPLERMGGEMRSILNEMIRMEQVVITPHIAGYSYEALYKMSAVILEKVIDSGE